MASSQSSGAAVTALRVEYLENPLGIDERSPRFSWQVAAHRRGVMQSAYQVQVAQLESNLERGVYLLWDSGQVRSGESASIVYQGAQVQSRQRYYWRARVWDEHDCPSEWSPTAWWEMGLLEEQDWSAAWIEPGWDEDPAAFKPCPYLRRAFTLDQPVRSARLYITAHGLYEAWINGQRVGDQVFTPGYTPYDKMLQYQVYDVTNLLSAGENAVGAILGDGWYRGKVYISGTRNVYGTRLGLLAQLVVETDAGRVVIATGEGWKGATGPILKSDMKDGEIYDARLEMPGWAAPGFDDSRWSAARVAAHSKQALVASMGVPVRRKETFRPTVLTTPTGETVLDFGQNLAGVVHMKVSGPRGTTVRLLHGEVLDKDGSFTRTNLLAAPWQDKKLMFQEVNYTLSGEGVEEYEPRFTVHGFRYVLLEGYPGMPNPDDFYSVAIYSDMPPTGAFDCSDPLITRLHTNTEWSMKSNFLDLPTDCPQRERAGWTGDAQIFAPSASFLMDTRAFFRKWLRELSIEQRADGMLGNFVPNPYRLKPEIIARLDGSSGWGDAAVLIPWALYWVYGDRRVLEEQYASMKAWVEYLGRRAGVTNWSRRISPRYWFSGAYRARQKRVWDTGYHWGEWLEPGTGGSLAMLRGMLSRILFGAPVVATAYYAHSARTLARSAEVLGKADEARKYHALADEIKAVYAREFIDPDGRIQPDRQASYVRVLAFDLAPAELKPKIVEHLVRLVKASGNRVATGFLSTVFLCQVLADNGHLDVAYDLLTQKTRPSWLYPVTKGATTIWETWEGVLEDGTVGNLSLNHYSPGAVIDFLHRVVAGVEAAQPGYACVNIHPQPGDGIYRARASYQSARGLIESDWAIEGDCLRLRVTIPGNTRAVITLPGAKAGQVTESGKPLLLAEGIQGATQSGPDTRIEAGAGQYWFEYPI